MIGLIGPMNWETFKNRVPNGTKIRFTHPHRDTSALFDGFLLENFPYSDMEFWAHVGQEKSEELYTKLRYQSLEASQQARLRSGGIESYNCSLFVDMVEYFIDERWLTFPEVMSDAS